MTTQEYRAADGENFSKLKYILDSPAHYKNPRKIDFEKSVEMAQGTILHAYVLEGLDLPYVVRPDYDPERPDEPWHGGRKSCKAWLAAQTVPVFSAEEVEDQVGMRDAVNANEDILALLAACPERERPIFADYKGIKLKALLDSIGHDASGRRLILDIKTTGNASQEAFSKSVINLRYCLQMAFYSTALACAEGLGEPPAWLWIAVENKRPYNTAIYAPSPEHWVMGMKQLDYCVDLLKLCRQNDRWPGYATGVQTLSWKPWDDKELTDYENE